jgi:meiotically up-regulated gene 157 (Mug157) protein
MQISTDSVFPGLELQVPGERYKRIDDTLQTFFNRNLIEKRNGLPFISTGDIPAMWLRDSTWQVKPLLKSVNSEIIDFLIRLSKSQIEYFLIDPYANAFNCEPNGAHWNLDFENQSPWVYERKFELDSWASILYLARKICETYDVNEHLDSNFTEAFELMLELGKIEQNHDPGNYVFWRDNGVPHDSLSNKGHGNPVAYTGMIYSAFRPSDDACVYGYLVPANIFFMSELKKLTRTNERNKAAILAEQIQNGIDKHAVVNGLFAYEVDGMGNQLMMDDANVPSLLSLPHIEAIDYRNPIYLKTRQFLLSNANPYYFSGERAKGIGSQHTPDKHVWPIAMAVEALTSFDRNKQNETIDKLEETDASTGRMHESFHVDDETRFTREWFSWADMTYVDLVLTSIDLDLT